ncbi:hypothetical protein J4Q44_G00384970 [Coregonus suidteri]|uniref:Uncharacterized protein n=1 Tax=Coregonus suidteri TaxID=861788 RepID=A0AAN8KLM9_9TELE
MRATAAVLLVHCLLAISHAWDCQEVVNIKNLMQIDAGLGQVVATDTSQIPYYLLNQDCQNKGWSHIGGKLSMIEVATDGSVFGVNSLGDVYTRDGITASKPEGTGWSNVPMCLRMKHVTYDLGRLWVVSKSGVTMVCTR